MSVYSVETGYLPPQNSDCKGAQSKEKNTNSSIMNLFLKCRNQWRYGAKGVSFTKGVTKSVKSLTEASKERLALIADHLGLASAVAIPFHVYSVSNSVSEFQKSLKINDSEGLILKGLGIGMCAGDLVDTGVSFSKTVCNLAEHSAEKILSYVGLGFGFALLSLSTVSKSMKLAGECRFRDRLSVIDLNAPHDISVEALKIHNFVTSIIGGSAEEREAAEKEPDGVKKLEKRKYATLKRATSGKIADEIQKLYKEKCQDTDKLKEVLAKANTLSKRKIVVDCISIVSNTIKMIALSFFLIAAVPAVVPTVVLTTMTVIKVGMMIYEDFFIERNL